MPNYQLVATGKGARRLDFDRIDLGDRSRASAQEAAREYKARTGVTFKVRLKKNPVVRVNKIKLGKWISAARVRVVKKNGLRVIEIKRVIKPNRAKKKNKRKSRR